MFEADVHVHEWAQAGIPETKHPAVVRALHHTFGTNRIEGIQAQTGRLTAMLVLRVVVRGTPYLLRIIPEQSFGLPEREFACMRLASEAAIAPAIRYANVDDRLLITDFVAAKPYPVDPAPQIARMIRAVHALPDFPMAIKYFDVLDGFIRRFQAARLIPESATAELFRLYAKMAQVYPREDDLVASHNDLKPQNILFDGTRFWLVDWEAAFLSDRFTDLAVAANFFVFDYQAEEAYLQAYFSAPATPLQRARFFLMRQAVSVFYGTCFMPLGAKTVNPAEVSEELPDWQSFHRGLTLNEIDVADDRVKIQYARLHFNRALENMQSPRFEESLALVAAAAPTREESPSP
jgi:aminoglycoside phosphotransferase (APT) family kinase protein